MLSLTDYTILVLNYTEIFTWDFYATIHKAIYSVFIWFYFLTNLLKFNYNWAGSLYITIVYITSVWGWFLIEFILIWTHYFNTKHTNHLDRIVYLPSMVAVGICNNSQKLSLKHKLVKYLL